MFITSSSLRLHSPHYIVIQIQHLDISFQIILQVLQHLIEDEELEELFENLYLDVESV